MAKPGPGSDHQDIEARAARFLMLAQEPDCPPEAQAGLDAWLDASPAHQAAYWRLEAGYGEADRLKSLPSMTPARFAPWRLAARQWQRPALAASLAVLAVGLGAGLLSDESWLGRLRVWLAPNIQAQTYATRAGQISSIALDDGSQVQLNVNSGIRAAVSAHHREVWLTHGEAYFEVAKDHAHPFVIHSGKNDITVVGTRFGVVDTDGRLTLSVVEGAVRLQPGPGVHSAALLVLRGHVARVDGHAVSLAATSPDTIEDGLGWRYGFVHFDNTTLAEAARQFNRYTERKLVVDKSAAQIRIGGTFRLGNADGFVRIMSENYGLKYRERDEDIILGE